MAYIKKIKLPNSQELYDIYDAGAARQNELEQKITQANAYTDEKFDSLVDIKIIDFSNNASLVERGSVVNSVILSWSLNKSPSAQEVYQVNTDGSEKSLALDALVQLDNNFELPISNAQITENTIFKLVVTNNNSTKEKNTEIHFSNVIYYGVIDEKLIDETTIKNLSKSLQKGKTLTVTETAGPGQGFVDALPASEGENPIFTIGGMEYEWTKLTSPISLTNSSNYTENYNVWRHGQSGVGQATIKVH